MEKDWFHYIKDFPLIEYDWNRDGYYNAWKIFLVKEIYDSIDKDDILYYVDNTITMHIYYDTTMHVMNTIHTIYII
jgi:hypothetical protein